MNSQLVFLIALSILAAFVAPRIFPALKEFPFSHKLGMAFPTNCLPRIVSVDDSCGCTLTRASIRAMTPQDFEDQALKEVGMDKVIAATAEARMAGVPESSLMDLLQSKYAPVKTINLSSNGGRSIIAPFILVPQRTVINANYFTVTNGVVCPTAGVGSVPASAWDLTVQNSASQFATTLVNLEKYFSPGHYVQVLYVDGANGNVGRTVQFRVVASVNADGGGVSKATVTLEPNYSAAGWAGLGAGAKAVYQPTHGVLIPLTNSVSNYESWCYNRPSVNPTKLLSYWLQTERETHCYNDEYLKALNSPLTSNFFKKFRELDLAQQKKQQQILADKAFFNTVFFGQRINENQTVEGYQTLPQVVDPANTSCVLEYKANTLGLRTQLNDCSRVIDLQGGDLNLDTIFALAYELKRRRESSGTVEVVDLMTDRFTRSGILTTMISYYKQKYGMNTERFYQVNQTLKFDNVGLFDHDLFDLPEHGLRLAVFSHNYFDDKLGAFTGADANRGRTLWGIDWSDVKIGLAGAQVVQRQTNILDNLYNCVITPNVNHYNLASKTFTVMLEDANRHTLIENFSPNCPTVTATACQASA